MRQNDRIKFIVPNLITTANIGCGFASILASIDGNFVAAAWAIIAAGIFDLFDGRVARLLNASSPFGEEYDTLSDLLSFGVAPAVLYFQCAARPLGTLGAALALGYLLCVAFRLARFNLGTSQGPGAYFQGLASPPAASTAAAFVLFSTTVGLAPELHRTASIAVFSGLALLMVSHLRFPSFKKMNWKSPGGVFALVTLAALAALALVHPGRFLFPILFALLAIVGLLDIRHRLVHRAS
jgi:CDP-diacylglycerol--serine O-phosphatidyltransferase